MAITRKSPANFPDPSEKRSTGGLLAFIVIALVIGAIAGGYHSSQESREKDETRLRGQVLEGVRLAETAKTAVAEFYANHDGLPTDNKQAGLSAPDTITNTVVASVTVSTGGVTVIFGNQADPLIAGRRLSYMPHPRDHVMYWDCGTAAGSTVDIDYRPAPCRQ